MSWGASMTTHSSSSPITQTLFSTSKVSPSREKVPEVTVWSIRASGHITTTERSTFAAVHLREGRVDVVDADLLGDERVQRQPALQVEVDQHREVAVGQAVAVPAGLQ